MSVAAMVVVVAEAAVVSVSASLLFVSFIRPSARRRLWTAFTTVFNLHGGDLDFFIVTFVPHFLRSGKLLQSKNRSDVVSTVSFRSCGKCCDRYCAG